LSGKREMMCCVVETGVGFVGLVSNDGKMVRSTLPRRSRNEALETVLAGLPVSYVEDEAAFGDLPDRLRRYFAGERVDFDDVEVDLNVYGPFQAEVIRAAKRVPYGELVTYRDLAGMAGKQAAARAAGTAMARNQTPVIVPCHRVVASGGKLGGFSLGLEWKRELLRLEGVDI